MTSGRFSSRCCYWMSFQNKWFRHGCEWHAFVYCGCLLRNKLLGIFYTMRKICHQYHQTKWPATELERLFFYFSSVPCRRADGKPFWYRKFASIAEMRQRRNVQPRKVHDSKTSGAKPMRCQIRSVIPVCQTADYRRDSGNCHRAVLSYGIRNKSSNTKSEQKLSSGLFYYYAKWFSFKNHGPTFSISSGFSLVNVNWKPQYSLVIVMTK